MMDKETTGKKKFVRYILIGIVVGLIVNLVVSIGYFVAGYFGDTFFLYVIGYPLPYGVITGILGGLLGGALTKKDKGAIVGSAVLSPIYNLAVFFCMGFGCPEYLYNLLEQTLIF